MSALPNMPQSLDYILIEQEVAHIEQYCLNATGQWILSDVIGLQARLHYHPLIVRCPSPMSMIWLRFQMKQQTRHITTEPLITGLQNGVSAPVSKV